MENIVKQYAFNTFGNEDVFEEIETKLSLSVTKDILVKVERVGINPVDTMHRSGVMSSDKSPNSYIVLGSELQGEIIDMLKPIPGLSIGDKVIVKMTTGAYADKVAINHSHVFKIPDGMPLDFAAGFSSTAITAYWAVNGPFYDFKSGDTVAVIGASGAVGSFAIQLLKDKDVHVIAVASEKNRDLLISLGAETFINYNAPSEIEAHVNSVDYIIDASLFNSGEKVALNLIKDGGTYLAMTRMPQIDGTKKITAKFLSRNASMTVDRAMEALFDFYNQHGLKLEIAYKLPLNLEGVKEAHRLIVSSRKSGKIILSNEV